MKISDKLPTEKFSGGRYSIVAWARGHQVLYYREFGSYQGEWIMVSFLKKEYYIWKGCFGSCSGCDSYEAEFDYEDSEKGIFAWSEKTKKFIEDYKPFLEVPASTFRNLAKQGPEAIGRITPANIRTEYTDITWDSLFVDLCLLVKSKEGLEVTVQEIIKASDQ